MRYAISNWIYGDEPLRRTFERLSRYGYQGIELVGEPGRYSLPEVRALSAEFGIPVASVLSWGIWGIPGRDLASPDEGERAAALRYEEACVDLAASLGAPFLVVLPAPAGRTAPTGRPTAEAEWKAGFAREWALAVDSLRRLAGYAAKNGIVLALEPINRYETFMVTNVDQALRFLEEVGTSNLKLHLDTFHMNIEEADPAAAIRRAGDLVVNMHLSDSNRETPGRGHTDFAAMLRALTGIGYEGVLALEPVPPGSDALLASAMSEAMPLRDIYAEEGIRYLKQCEAGLGDMP